MRFPKKLCFKIACCVSILSGLGHALGHFIAREPATAAEKRMHSLMSAYQQEFAGSLMSVTDIIDGLNLCYALFLIFAGGLNLLLLRKPGIYPVMDSVCILNASVFACGFVIAGVYFTWVHLLYLGSSSVLFMIARPGRKSAPFNF